ncbi:FKBP-type peptidyl-prolyl cis-trans isomerase [Shivajiella indica]|uniref:Peptidyl-prolyl cis-trans isomerase n=1 Tax=Shivajiella indica TaxID=872115 RepID=A0ABW5BGW2_9BACT
MKRLGIGILSLLILFSGCVSDEENNQIIFDRDLQKIEDYLSENPIASVKELEDPATGIRILWQEVSESGKSPVALDTIVVDYVGKLLNNSVFDTSIESVARAKNIFNPNRTYEPLQFLFGTGDIIPGFEFAIFKMEEGDKATVIMPSLYGYGSFEQGGIPKNSPLIFELDLIQIKGVVEDEVLD